jgi:hypothetical protein
MANQLAPSDGQSHRLDMDLLTDDRDHFLMNYLAEQVFVNPEATIQQLNQDLRKINEIIGYKIVEEFQTCISPEVIVLIAEGRRMKREIKAREIFKPAIAK